MAKTDKSKGMQFLVKGVNDASLPDNANTMFIQDGNALFRAMTDIPRNFPLIFHWIFDNIPKRINFVSSGLHQEYGNRATWFQ